MVDVKGEQGGGTGLVVKAPRTFDGATCTKVNWGRVSMKESSNKVELRLKREREV